MTVRRDLRCILFGFGCLIGVGDTVILFLTRLLRECISLYKRYMARRPCLLQRSLLKRACMGRGPGEGYEFQIA